MGMKISKEYAYGDMNSPYGAEWRKDVEYYSDINGEQLDPSNMILADGYLMSMEQFYKKYGIEQYPLVDEDKVCDECLSKDSIEWHIGIDKLYLCDECFNKWLEDNEYVTDEDKIYEYYVED